ncbi:hypothetical protein LTR97_010784 [Elasticomyces elasticus]|uniref:BTB domain-containing protein n=1 Tax=Elasticomyces elasticus TaxID=574655 RepID=A0AAN7ZW98_9PEZI|nr:hypothetical protein LTR97_010784 [Elasticomyces elasticus]KAK5718646.1 hypothetical protein LTR15_008379 [Elasticomyces elasticus]
MASHHIAIQSEADVIITYHNQQGSITHTLFVSSSILRHGSGYFNDVLGRSIQQYTAVNLVGLPLQGDDLQAMVMMCRVLHYQFPTVPGGLTPAGLRAMAVVAGKYGCTGALKVSSELWISKFLKTAVFHQLPDILYAAYHFRQAELFGDVGKELILRSQGPIADVAGSEISACIEYLNAERQDILRQLQKFIEGDIEHRSTLCAIDEEDIYDSDEEDGNNSDDDYKSREDQKAQCPRSAFLVTVLLRRLSNAGVWPVSAWSYSSNGVSSIVGRRARLKSVSSVLGSMRSFCFRPIDFENFRRPLDSEDRDAVSTCGSRYCSTDNPGHAIRKEYAKEATRVAESVPRACYHCFREGSGYECIAKGEGEAAAGSNAETG